MTTATIKNDELITEGEVKAGDIYPGFCCAGFDYEIALVNPEYPLESLWGCCHNPVCPVAVEYDRGVSWWMIEDFAAKVAGAQPMPHLT